MRTLALAALVAGLCLSSAHAVQPTADEKAACYPDAARYCQSAMHNLFPMLSVFACMMDHRAQLSKKCDAVFKAHGY